MNSKRITYKKLLRTIAGAWIYGHMALLVVSCTKAEMSHQEPNYVRIHPDQSVYTLPALQYHFYNVDTRQAVIVRPGNSKSNFEGTLPEGVYRVIAVNTAAVNTAVTGNVVFDMDSYETANASALPTEQTNSQLSTLSSQLSTLYSVVEEIVVPFDTIYQPKPMLLTKQVVLVFLLRDGLDSSVAKLTSILSGVYPSVVLHTGQPSEESINQSPETSIRFETSGRGEQREAQANLFGLCNPQYGNVYRNTLQVDLDMNDGDRQAITIDVTNILSDIIAWNRGVVPPQLTLYIEIKQNAIGIGGVVTGWSNEGEIQLIVDN
jgi:hypothetical protein